MSYEQNVKWSKSHVKGNLLAMNFSTGSQWGASWCNVCNKHLRSCTCKFAEVTCNVCKQTDTELRKVDVFVFEISDGSYICEDCQSHGQQR